MFIQNESNYGNSLGNNIPFFYTALPTYQLSNSSTPFASRLIRVVLQSSRLRRLRISAGRLMVVPVRDDHREQSGRFLHRTHTSPTIHIPAALVPAIPIGHRALAIVLGQRIAVDDKQVSSALPLHQIQRLVVQRDGLL